MLKQAVTA